MTFILTTPLGWVFLAGLAMILVRLFFGWTRDAKTGTWQPRRFFRPFLLLWLATMALSTDQVARWIADPLERGELAVPLPNWLEQEVPEAIVALGGGLAGPARPGVPLSAASTERLFAALAAARAWPEAMVLFSGGDPDGGEVSSGTRMAEEALRLGLSPERILVERQARTTRENAVYGAGVLRQHGFKRVALVTSAVHMPRALASFWHEAFVCLPVKASAPGVARWHPALLVPDAQALVRTTGAVHEWLGLAWYRYKGWLTP